MKKLVLILLSAVSFMFAGSTSTTVPVTIDVTQTCSVNSFQASYDVGSVPSIIGTDGVILNPLSFQINCSNGLSYQIKPDGLSYAIGDDYTLKLLQDDKFHSVDEYTPWNLKGTGGDETINLYPVIKPNGNCTDLPNGEKLCSAGAISGSVTIKISW